MSVIPKPGADESGAGAPEIKIEITPAMLDAGARVLCGFETFTADEHYWARKVYEAMQRVAPSQSSAPM